MKYDTREKKNRDKGFIALISAIIISVLLLTITLGISAARISGRLNILDSESKERSNDLAEACANTAIYNLSQNSIYNPVNQSVSVGSDTCKIISKQVSGTQTTFKTQAIINRAYTNLIVVVDDSFNIVSWDESPSF